jgi:hypothetical protein
MYTTAEVHSSPEYIALRTRLTSKPSISSNEISNVARAITKPTANNFQAGCDESELEKYLWRAWAAVINFAAETPHEQQDALVEVVKMVRRTDLTGGDLQTARVWGIRVWRGAPVFGACMREHWDRGKSLLWTCEV